MIRRSDRLFITGTTGSGKSHLARRIFQSVAPPRCVIDPKDDPDATGGAFADRRVAQTFHDPLRIPDADVIRFVPRDPDDIDGYDQLYSKLFDIRGMFVWADEAGTILPATGGTPGGARRFIKMGRRWGLGHMALNQRPVEIARTVPANSEHVMMFRNGYPDDLASLAGFVSMPPRELADHLRRLQTYGFAWYAAREQQLTLCPPIGG